MVGLPKVPLMLDAPLPVAPPVRPPVTTGTDQLYVVLDGTIPLVELTGVDVKPVPPQVVAVIAVMAGVGFTVTVTVKVEPTQPSALVGVIV